MVSRHVALPAPHCLAWGPEPSWGQAQMEGLKPGEPRLAQNSPGRVRLEADCLGPLSGCPFPVSCQGWAQGQGLRSTREATHSCRHSWAEASGQTADMANQRAETRPAEGSAGPSLLRQTQLSPLQHWHLQVPWVAATTWLLCSALGCGCSQLTAAPVPGDHCPAGLVTHPLPALSGPPARQMRQPLSPVLGGHFSLTQATHGTVLL